jgi:hypothetical protein
MRATRESACSASKWCPSLTAQEFVEAGYTLRELVTLHSPEELKYVGNSVESKSVKFCRRSALA